MEFIDRQETSIPIPAIIINEDIPDNSNDELKETLDPQSIANEDAENQRNLLHAVFESWERQGSKQGMNMDEFKQFQSQLPEDYRDRFDRMVCLCSFCSRIHIPSWI